MEISISGRVFTVSRELSRNRNAVARLRDGVIRITLPSRWPASERERVADNLLKRSIRAIESGRWRDETQSRVAFAHGQAVTAMGMPFEIYFFPGSRFGSRMRGNRIEVRTDETHPSRDAKASAIVRRRITAEVLPALIRRVEGMNRAHFGAALRSVRVRDTISRWGSCSRDGDISLSFRLLFMPEEILDYVIAHELAHTRFRGHGQRFWALVGKVVPDHMERRRWLRENGWAFPPRPGGKGSFGAEGGFGGTRQQLILSEGEYEEPY